ncbi:MAG: energy transducer TonB [Proteobacteria bacterium]|nr:energy transducer TonB [Pseudomonadota bacterium]
MRIRISLILAVSAAVVSGVMLFSVSQKVQTAESEQRRLSAAVEGERETIRVLNAEWDYLNRPDRVEDLAREYLRMKPPQAGQMESDAAVLPEAPPSVMIGRKPELEAQPAALVAQPIAPVPARKPERGGQDFRRVLDEIAPAAGGGR